MFCPECFHDKGRARACPECGFKEAAVREAGVLPYRHELADGRYVVGRVLGKPGGFGVAYKALDTRQHALVVIKECMLTASNQVAREPGGVRVQVNDDFRSDYRKWLGRFRDEAGRIARFRSPFIVRVTDIFDENNTAYYVMPFVDGEELSSYCAAHPDHLPEPEVKRLAMQLLEALEEMHAMGVVHCDIKPSNILVTGGKRKPVLIDFGAARDHFEDDRSRSYAVYTQAYAALEQIQFSKHQGPWTDLYALCGAMHFCLVGEPPPKAIDRASVLVDPYVAIGSRRTDIGERLATFIDAGLALRPEDRLRTAGEAIEVLQGAITRRPPAPPDRTGSPSPPTPPVPERHRVGRAAAWPIWVGLLPAIAMVLLGLVAETSFSRHFFSWPGLIIVGNVAIWLAWGRNRGSSATRAGPEVAPPEAPSVPMPPGSESGPPGLPAIEIRLSSDGADPIVRTIRAGQRITVGRTNRSDVAIPNDLLSAQHVVIEVNAYGEFDLRDLQSANHTFAYERGPRGESGSWSQVRSAAGEQGRFMLGPQEAGGVLLEICQARMEP